jgi:hypothetical protein
MFEQGTPNSKNQTVQNETEREVKGAHLKEIIECAHWLSSFDPINLNSPQRAERQWQKSIQPSLANYNDAFFNVIGPFEEKAPWWTSIPAIFAGGTCWLIGLAIIGLRTK